MKTLFITSLILLITFKSTSQSFWDKIEIKKSFENKIDKDKPAIASFSLPTGAKKYFTINGGVAYRLSKLGTGSIASKTQWDLFGVYNRNNQLNKEQHNYKGGISMEKKIVFGNTTTPRLKPNGTAKDLFLLYISFTNEYIRDRIDSVSSFGSLLYFSPYFKISEKLKIGKPVISGNGRFLSYLKVMPGLEYQNKFEVSKKETTGSLTRLFFSSSYEFYLRWHKEEGNSASGWVNMFESSISYTYRNDFYNSTSEREGYLPLFSYTLAFYPFRNNNISFGATYQKGSDPLADIDHEEFWLFEFKFKKSIK
jgi:hypothetical protein